MNRMYITDEELSFVIMGLDALMEVDSCEAKYTQDEALRRDLEKRIEAVQDLFEALQWRVEEVKCI